MGREESRSKEGKWSVRAEQGKGEVGEEGQHPENTGWRKGNRLAGLLGQEAGAGRTLALEGRSTRP